MLKHVVGDLVTGDFPVFCHQVNCRGKMGSGVAGQIREKYPEVFQSYDKCVKTSMMGTLLGSNDYCETHDGRVCVNMFAQMNYGYDGKKYTSYDGFWECLNGLKYYLNNMKDKYKTVAFPYKIGCGLGGANWDIIEKMIDEFSNSVSQEVIIVRREND